MRRQTSGVKFAAQDCLIAEGRVLYCPLPMVAGRLHLYTTPQLLNRMNRLVTFG
ncbi:MAG: hypothetical protein ACI8X5_004010 [Planctomycetota bacterium]|jgi:hypothetical protein